MLCEQPRRTEELQVIRHLDNGVQQFVCQLRGEKPPHTQSLWVSADGYFYGLYIVAADVSHRSFPTPTMVLKAAGNNQLFEKRLHFFILVFEPKGLRLCML